MTFLNMVCFCGFFPLVASSPQALPLLPFLIAESCPP